MKMNLKKGEIAANYDERFISTSKGRIYDTLLKKWKRQSNTPSGYLNVGLYGKGFRAHRVIAISFLPNPENKPTVNHKNGIRNDNRIDNLEWATHQENNLHAYKSLGRIGRNMSHVRGEKPIIATNKLTGIKSRYQNRKYAAKALGVGVSMITMAANGLRLSCKGYLITHEKSPQWKPEA